MRIREAIQILLDHTHDAGAPDADEHLGRGILHIERILDPDPSQRYDIAIADYYLDLKEGLDQLVPLSISVQNRRTQWTGNLELNVTLDDQTDTYTLNHLNVGEVTNQQWLLDPKCLLHPDGLSVRATVKSRLFQGTRPENNRKASLLRIHLPEPTPSL